MQKPFVRFDHVEKSYDGKVLVVQDLTLDIAQGAFLTLLGPSGSGKTTTLYSILNEMNTESVNIMTLEDPVEYPLNLMRQTSVNEVARMDFANGIRSIMRQDPDIILVGEVRDKGLFMAVELVSDRSSRAPAGTESGRLINLMRERGALISRLGRFDNVLKLRPPLPFGREHADILLATLDECLAAL